MATRKIKIPDKLKPLLYLFVGIMTTFLARSIMVTSFYQDLANSDTIEYHLGLAESYIQEMRESSVQDGKWNVVNDRLVFQPGDNAISLAHKALIAYHKAIELNPLSARSHLLLAWHYGTLHDLISCFPTRFPQLDKPNKPDKPPTLLISKAKREFRLAIELDPSSSYNHQVLATWAFNQAKKDPSWLNLGIEEYRKAITIDPALAAQALNHYFSFTRHYDRLKEILPQTYDAVIILADLLYDNGAWEENEPIFLEEMKQRKTDYQHPSPLEPKNRELYPYYQTLAKIYVKKGVYDRAIATLQEYLELEPDNADVHFWLADYSFYYGKNFGYSWVFSKLHHQKAVDLSPDNAIYRKWYGRHLYYQKELKESMYQLRKAVELDSEDNEAHKWLEECYQKTTEYGLPFLFK